MPPSDKGGHAIQHYNICVEPSKGCDNCQDGWYFTSSNTCLVVTNLVAGVNYNFTVGAVNCHGEGPPTTVIGSLKEHLSLIFIIPVTVVVTAAVITTVIIFIIALKKQFKVSKHAIIVMYA